jgi:hypothetical protein
LHDFVRQPTILNYLMRDRALLALDACAGRDNAGIDATQLWLRPKMQSCDQYAGYSLFRCHLKNFAAALSVVSGAIRFGIARGRLWRKAANRQRRIRDGAENQELGTISRTCFSTTSTKGASLM